MEKRVPAGPSCEGDPDRQPDQGYSLWAVHSHCPACGQACLWNPVSKRFTEIETAQPHVCVPTSEHFVCECGTLLTRSAFGYVMEADRNGIRPHQCLAEH